MSKYRPIHVFILNGRPGATTVWTRRTREYFGERVSMCGILDYVNHIGVYRIVEVGKSVNGVSEGDGGKEDAVEQEGGF